MQLRDDVDLLAFLNQIDKCKQDVYFKSTDGDNLNLKSQLSRYVMAVVANNRDFLLKGIISCKNEDDYKVLSDYLVELK